MIYKFFKKLTKKIRKARKSKNKFLFRLIPIKTLKNISTQFLVLALLTGLNWTGFWAVGTTVGFFNDTETSSENLFLADSLDFSLSGYEFESFIGLDETVSKNTVIVNSGGMDFQYTLGAEEVSDEDDLCDALNLQAKLNGVEQYDGDLMSLATLASTTLGTWRFNIELPVDEDSFANGEECQFDVVFKGWQANVPSYGDSGFTDEERMSFTITSGQMVVLNEFLPRPSGVAYGFDFGNDSSDMPQGEWVELYNNSTEAVDLTGWYIRDATDGDGNKTNITALNTAPASTTIAGKGWLVVYMNKAILNNTGDTVRLFNDGDVLVDSHSYDDPDFCEIEPTPGDENSTDASGSCGSVPPNKSYARIPDGIGEWVDPIPTPGGVNVLEGEAFSLSSAYIDASGSGAGTGEIIIEEIIINAEEVTVEETPVNVEEVVVVEEKTVIEEEPTTVEEEVVIQEEITSEPEPEPEPEPTPLIDSGQANNDTNETI